MSLSWSPGKNKNTWAIITALNNSLQCSSTLTTGIVVLIVFPWWTGFIKSLQVFTLVHFTPFNGRIWCYTRANKCRKNDVRDRNSTFLKTTDISDSCNTLKFINIKYLLYKAKLSGYSIVFIMGRSLYYIMSCLHGYFLVCPHTLSIIIIIVHVQSMCITWIVGWWHTAKKNWKC